MTPSDLTTMLASMSDPSTIVFVYTDTKGNVIGAVAKINFDYGKELNAQQLADGQEITKPGGRSWGAKVPDCPLVGHKDKFYLAVWVTQTIFHRNSVGDSLDDVSGYRDLKIEGIQMLITDKILNIE